MAGDWRRALDLLDHDRAAVREEAQRHAVQGLEIRRVRVAEMPIGPYLQWELHALKLLADEGGGLSVLTADQVSALETRVPLPEVNVVGDRVLYHIQYEDDGTPCGARRITDPAVIGAAASEIEALYGRGEPLLSFFDRARTAREQARRNALALSHEGDLDRALGQAAGDTGFAALLCPAKQARVVSADGVGPDNDSLARQRRHFA